MDGACVVSKRLEVIRNEVTCLLSLIVKRGNDNALSFYLICSNILVRKFQHDILYKK
jgi:hypothetical protein